MAKGPYLHLEPVFLSLRLGRMLQGTRTAFAPVLGGTHPTTYCSGVWTPYSAFPTCWFQANLTILIISPLWDKQQCLPHCCMEQKSWRFLEIPRSMKLLQDNRNWSPWPNGIDKAMKQTTSLFILLLWVKLWIDLAHHFSPKGRSFFFFFFLKIKIKYLPCARHSGRRGR